MTSTSPAATRRPGTRPDVAARNRVLFRIVSYCRRCSADRRAPSGRMRGGLGLCDTCYQQHRRSR